MNGSRDLLALIGRILLVLIFVLSGWSKISGFAMSSGYMAGAGIPHVLVTPGLILSILIEFGGGLMIVIGLRTRWVALLIFLWLIPVTVIFHYLPMRAGQNAMVNTIMVMKNISMMGGLLFLAAMGPGAYSLDGAAETDSTEAYSGRQPLARPART
jgi:putative oxidoreductase